MKLTLSVLDLNAVLIAVMLASLAILSLVMARKRLRSRRNYYFPSEKAGG